MGVIIVTLVKNGREGVHELRSPFPGRAPVKALVMQHAPHWLPLLVMLLLDYRILLFYLYGACKQRIFRFLS